MISILIKILIGWGITIALSLLLLIIAITIAVTVTKRQERLAENFGIKAFFKEIRHAGSDNLIWLVFLVPFLNLFMAGTLLLMVCTDWGSDW